MDDGQIFVILIIGMTVVAPIWIIAHYITTNRANPSLSREDEEMLGEIWETTKRMEARIETLERILDDTGSNWRRST